MNKMLLATGDDGAEKDYSLECGSICFRVGFDFWPWADYKDDNPPLDDEMNRDLRMILPPSYKSGHKKYPVVFMLPGYTGTGESYFSGNPWTITLKDQLWDPWKTGDLREMIVVCPDCWTKYGGSQYINSRGTGDYESYLLAILKYVDNNFRTIPKKQFRAIVGHSSGGFGAIRMGMRNSIIFGHIADHAGDKGFEMVYKPEFPEFLRAYARVGEEGFKKILNNPRKANKNKDFFTLMHMAAMCSCYSPNKNTKLGFDFPITLDTCDIKPDVWNKWLAFDPIHVVAENKQVQDSLSDLDTIYLDCGIDDEYNLLYGARKLSRILKDKNIEHFYEEFNGGHRHNAHRYLTSLKYIGNRMPKNESKEQDSNDKAGS